MREDRAYLERTALEMRERHGLTVSSVLALGDPPSEILRLSEESHCDLIAMTTHGHRLFGDILFGSTIDYVRHRSKTPLLIVSPKTSWILSRLRGSEEHRNYPGEAPGGTAGIAPGETSGRLSR